jgi:TolA-binding protein
VNNYERTALALAKENRQMQAEIGSLRYEIETLKAKNNYLTIQLDQKGPKDRSIASVSPGVPAEMDLVKFDTYKWTPAQVLAVAEKEFDQKNFEKAAQYFHAFTLHYPGDKKLDDQLLFQAGVAAFESGKHYDWSRVHLERLVTDYPNSKYYRGAKLWLGLSHLEQGDDKRFFETVEEFRKKYRNTDEWKILSQHYEKIVQKYKPN